MKFWRCFMISIGKCWSFFMTATIAILEQTMFRILLIDSLGALLYGPNISLIFNVSKQNCQTQMNTTCSIQNFQGSQFYLQFKTATDRTLLKDIAWASSGTNVFLSKHAVIHEVEKFMFIELGCMFIYKTNWIFK